MEQVKSAWLRRGIKVSFILLLWAATAWLLYPLLILDSVNLINAKEYLYRSAAGITIMLILFGKTITDLLFPQDISPRKSLFYTIFLTFYSLALMTGVLYMISRVVAVYLQSSSTSSTGLPFQ